MDSRPSDETLLAAVADRDMGAFAYLLLLRSAAPEPETAQEAAS